MTSAVADHHSAARFTDQGQTLVVAESCCSSLWPRLYIFRGQNGIKLASVRGRKRKIRGEFAVTIIYQ